MSHQEVNQNDGGWRHRLGLSWLTRRPAHRLTARWVFPVDGPPVSHGVVEIKRGRIVAVHTERDGSETDLGDVALLPGLVNTHTHLEFSDLDEPLGPSDCFTDWIRTVIRHRQERTGDISESIAGGVAESLRSGVTTLGEMATRPASVDVLAASPMRSVVFLELIGLSQEAITKSGDICGQFIPAVVSPSRRERNLTRGLSPHAPYSCHPDLVRAAARYAARGAGCPIAMHVAETPAERELLDHRSGEFVRFLREMELWQPDLFPPSWTLRQVLGELATAPHALVVHGNDLTDAEIDLIARHPHMSVVYCPRTHAYFGHDPHPWQRMLDAGVRVVLGTDSRASNPDLNLWNEVRFLHQHFPNVDPAVLLRMATLDGATALGLADETGSLTPGKSADLCVLPLADVRANNPFAALFADSTQASATMVAGRWIDLDDTPVDSSFRSPFADD